MLEEEDLPFPTFSCLLVPQPANNPSPKQRMQLKTSLPKMQLRVFFFF
jgi:hypothetical protein